MKNEVLKEESIGNELKFPVAEKKSLTFKLGARPLSFRLTSGYLAIIIIVMGIRIAFFINSSFTDGVVSDIQKSPRGYSFDSHITFTTSEGKTITFIAAPNLRLDIGERVRVIYKNKNPKKAAVYSFFGFWFNSILVCQVLAMFWVGLLVVYYGDYP